MLILGGFQPKMKKMNMDSEQKLKVCFIKVCSDFAKMAQKKSYKHILKFSNKPLRGAFPI